MALAAGAAGATPTWELPWPHTRIEITAEVDRGDLAPGHPAWPVGTVLTAPTDRYPHDVLGSVPGWGQLDVRALSCGMCRHGWEGATIVLPETRVFEDVAARLWDITGEGLPEIVVVESDVALGARLTVWAYRNAPSGSPALRLLAATPFIGRRFRWLAPLGAADFTGDGQAEIAYVETPHLGRVLRLVALRGDRLVEIAALAGVTNHRIGEVHISGGVRDCGTGPEIIAARGDWGALLAVRYADGALVARSLGARTDAAAFAAALDCRS